MDASQTRAYALSPHQIRKAAAAAFRARQRAIAPAAIPRRVPTFRPPERALPAASFRLTRSSLRQIAPAIGSPAPSIEERLCAAAHRILSDGRQHSIEAQAWAVTFLARCAPSRELTTFIRAAMRRAPLSPRELQQLHPRAGAFLECVE